MAKENNKTPQKKPKFSSWWIYGLIAVFANWISIFWQWELNFHPKDNHLRITTIPEDRRYC